MSDDIRLFDVVVEQALGGEPLDTLMEKDAVSVVRGDWERVRFLDEMLRVAVVLGHHAVVAEQSKRSRQ